jgi:branched-chain amino acid transport system substrate-binding protein
LRIRVPALVLAVLMFAAAAVQAQDSAQRPYEINAILPLTGSAAFIGDGHAGALRAAETYINSTGGIKGRPVHFVIADSQSKPQVNVQLTTGVLAKHPPFVIEGGPVQECNAAAPLYTKGPVMYCLSPGFFPEHGSYMYGAGIESRVGIGVVVRYLRMKGFKRLGVIMLTDIAGQEAEAALKAALNDPVNADVRIVDLEHFAVTDISVSAQMAKIKDAKPDVVVGWATGTPTGTLLLAYTGLGMAVPFVASQANENARQMQQYKSIMPRTLMMFSLMFPAASAMKNGPFKSAIDTYVKTMTVTGGSLGDSSSAEAWDAALILVGALRSLGADATAEQVHAYIDGLHDYYGPTGAFDFRIGNQRGLDASSASMVRWDQPTGSWKPISGPTGTPL